MQSQSAMPPVVLFFSRTAVARIHSGIRTSIKHQVDTQRMATACQLQSMRRMALLKVRRTITQVNAFDQQSRRRFAQRVQGLLRAGLCHPSACSFQFRQLIGFAVHQQRVTVDR